MVRRIFISLAVLLASLAFLFVAAFGYAQTRLAKGQIEGLIERQLTDEQRTAEVEGLGGLLPFDVHIGRFALSDREGTLVEAEDLRVKVRPSALLAGRVHVEEAGARRVAVERLPPAAEAPAPAEPAGLPAPPELPSSLPVFAVDRLHIDTLELGEAIVGERALFTVEGKAATDADGGRLDVALDVRRTDEATAQLSLRAGLDLAQQALDLDLEAHESGGLVGNLAGRPGAGPLRVKLVGSGPLRDFRGSLDLDIERLASAQASLALAYTDTPRLELDAELRAAQGALPAEYAALLGEHVVLRVIAAEAAPGVFVFDPLRLESAAATVEGGFRAELDSNRLEGRLVATVPDLSRASAVAGTDLAGVLSVTVEAGEHESAPRVAVHIEGDRLRLADTGVAALAADFDIVPQGPLAAGWQGAAMEGRAAVRGVTLAGEPLRPEDSIELEVEAGIPVEGAVLIRRLSAKGEHLELAGTGEFDPANQGGRMELQLRAPQLAELLDALGAMRPAGLELNGGAELRAEVELAAGAGALAADLALSTHDVTGWPGELGALLGSSPTLDARVDFRPGETVTVDPLDLRGAAAHLTGAVRYGLADDSLGGTLALELPELAALEAVVGQPITGKGRLQAELGGTLSAPDVRARSEAAPVTVAGLEIDSLVLDATARGPVEAARGRLVLAAVRGGAELRTSTDYALTQNTLELADLILEAPATRLTGHAVVDLDRLLATGELAGAIEDLIALEPWLGQKIEGAVRIDARFEAPDARQNANVRLELSRLVGGFGALYAGTIDAGVSDALGAPAFDVAVTAEQFVRPDLTIDAVSGRLRGPLDGLDVALAARGKQADGQTFALESEALLSVLGETKRLVLEKVSGEAGGQTLQLRKPATAVLEKGVLQIDELDLVIGEGTIRGGLQLGPDRVRAFADARNVPVAVLAALGGPEFRGAIDASLDVRGAVRSPVATVDGRVRDLRSADDLYAELPAADVRYQLRLADRQLTAAIAVERLEGTTADIRVTVPAELSLAPFSFALPRDGRLDGQLDARLELATLAALAGLDGQKLKGPLVIDLALSGTAARPRFEGRAEIAGARVEDSITGVTIRDLVIVVEASGSAARLVEVRGRDLGKGTLSGDGEITFDGARGYRYTVGLKLDDFIVSDNESAFVVADAKLELAGNERRGGLSGRIEVDGAEVSIPSGGGVEVPTLEVVEVGNGRATWQPDLAVWQPEPTGSGYPLILDVRLDMPARVFVRGRGLDSEWGGMLQLGGTLAAPVIEGQVEFRRGHLDLLDRRFVIREGWIRFVGSTPPRPEIHLVAAAEGEGMTAIVRLDGDIEDPRLELASEPELPQDEILARLLFGRDVSRITPLQGLRLAAAVRQLEGGDGLDVLAGLRETIGLDALDVGGESPAEAYVSAGKYIAENVYVEVGSSLATGETRARVEVELTPRVAVASEIGGQGTSNIEVEWRYDY